MEKEFNLSDYIKVLENNLESNERSRNFYHKLYLESSNEEQKKHFFKLYVGYLQLIKDEIEFLDEVSNKAYGKVQIVDEGKELENK